MDSIKFRNKILQKFNSFYGLIALILAVFALLMYLAGADFGPMTRSPAAMLSVSTDGRYVVSTHYGRYLILWDIEKRQKKVLNRHASIYSAYFIPDTHCFLWQDANTLAVYAQSIDGTIIKTLNPGFPVYGHVMAADLKHYMASENNWSLYQLKDGQWQRFHEGFNDLPGSPLLLQLTLKDKLLLTAGDGSCEGEDYPFKVGLRRGDLRPGLPRHADGSFLEGIVLWDAETGKPLRKFIGLVGKSKADLSPDGQYVVAGDEGSELSIWETRYGRRLYFLDQPTNPATQCHGQQPCLNHLAELMRTTKVIPDDFYIYKSPHNPTNIAVKFIDEDGHYLRFIEEVNYATLYHVSSPKILAYMDLGKKPMPYTVSLFNSANVIDTAPRARILVMAQSAHDMGRKGTG
ncbi:WD40 repeat domain-containing protein, partial [Legionella londiniensis]